MGADVYICKDKSIRLHYAKSMKLWHWQLCIPCFVDWMKLAQLKYVLKVNMIWSWIFRTIFSKPSESLVFQPYTQEGPQCGHNGHMVWLYIRLAGMCTVTLLLFPVYSQEIKKNANCWYLIGYHCVVFWFVFFVCVFIIILLFYQTHNDQIYIKFIPCYNRNRSLIRH